MTLYKRQVKYILYKYHQVGFGTDEIAATGWMDEDGVVGPWTWADSTGLHSGRVMLKTIEQFVKIDPNDIRE